MSPLEGVVLLLGWQAFQDSGIAALQRGEEEKARVFLERALAEAGGDKDLRLASTLSHLARTQLALGRPLGAKASLERALGIRQAALGEDHPGVATLYHQLGDVYQALGDDEQALKAYRKALAIDQRVLGRRHPHVANDLEGLAEAYRLQGKESEAQAFYREALGIAEEALGSRHPTTLRLRALIRRSPP